MDEELTLHQPDLEIRTQRRIVVMHKAEAANLQTASQRTKLLAQHLDPHVQHIPYGSSPDNSNRHIKKVLFASVATVPPSPSAVQRRGYGR